MRHKGKASELSYDLEVGRFTKMMNPTNRLQEWLSPTMLLFRYHTEMLISAMRATFANSKALEIADLE